MRIRSILLIFFCAGIFTVTQGQTRAVMLFLSAKDQPDTLGYNLVKELPALLYQPIVEGKIPLWDSPEKQIRIQPASLKAIEESNNLSFSASSQLFVLEKWDRNGNDLKCELSGFYFSDRSASGADISYGYVDFRDAEIDMTSTSISANANGSCFSTFKYIVLNHLYFFNFVQYGDKKIASLEESQKLKVEYASLLRAGATPPSESKKVIYSVEQPDTARTLPDAGANTNQIMRMTEEFLNNNKEVYLNLGGDKFSDYSKIGNLQVRAIEVEEIWTKSDTGYETQVMSLTIHMINGSLRPLTTEELWKMNIHSEETNLRDMLKQKEFYFRILSINADAVSAEESPKYLKALRKFSWNQVKEYVKYD